MPIDRRKRTKVMEKSCLTEFSSNHLFSWRESYFTLDYVLLFRFFSVFVCLQFCVRLPTSQPRTPLPKTYDFQNMAGNQVNSNFSSFSSLHLNKFIGGEKDQIISDFLALQKRERLSLRST